MTEQIKPKQCGENAWYIPNQKGFVPIVGQIYCALTSYGAASFVHTDSLYDYAAIDAGNCFETEQEALDAFVKPADPTPLTWDELCEIAKDNDCFHVYMLRLTKWSDGAYSNSASVIVVDTVHKYGRLDFEVNKYWRSKESLEAWIEQQKGELK